MASEASVAAVCDAIRSVYLGRREPKKATAKEVIAAAGVGQKTYYRVLSDHPHVARMLQDFENLHLKREATSEDVDRDPVRQNPRAAVDEALLVIGHLATVVHQQHKRIQDLQQSVDLLVDEQMSGKRPDTPSISAARKRWRSRQDHGT